MEINSVNNLNFGLRIKRTETFKDLINIWNMHFPKSSIKYRLNKLKEAANSDYYVEFVEKNSVDTVKLKIGNIFEKPKFYTLKTTFTEKSTKNKKHYTPKYLVKKIIECVKQYKAQIGNNNQPAWVDDLVRVAKIKAQLLV